MNEPTVAQALAGASKLFTAGECLRVLAREYRKEVARVADITGMITETVAKILEARMTLAGCPVRCEPGCGPDGQHVATYTGKNFEARYDGEVFYWRLDGWERWSVAPTLPGQILRD